MGAITVFVADDSVFIREGVKAMLSRQADLEIVGEAEDHDGLVAGAEAAAPNVVVSDIRMPPNFHREGIEACKLIRKRHPGTGIVILSQYDDPDYAISLLSEGAAGYAYLLKDRIAEGDQLARAIREVASGGSMLDPAVVSALISPVRRTGGLDAEDDALLEMVAEGKPIKAIAAATKSTPAAVEARVESLFLRLAEGVSIGTAGALDRLKRIHDGDRLPRGAGRVAVSSAAHRRGRTDSCSWRPCGRHRATQGHGADERHPRLLDDQRAHRPVVARPTAQHAPRRDEQRHPGRGRHGDAVRRRRRHGRVRRPGAHTRSR